MSTETIVEYTEVLIEGGHFPPLEVFHDESTGDYWLADGFHRYDAYVRAGHSQIPCRIHEGTNRDALRFGIMANQKHGLRRTQADKRRAVELILKDELWGNWSDRLIARRAGVSHPFVADVRAAMQQAKRDASWERMGDDDDEHGASSNYDSLLAPIKAASEEELHLPPLTYESAPITVRLQIEPVEEGEESDERAVNVEATAPGVIPINVATRLHQLAPLPADVERVLDKLRERIDVHAEKARS